MSLQIFQRNLLQHVELRRNHQGYSKVKLQAGIIPSDLLSKVRAEPQITSIVFIILIIVLIG